MGVSREDAPHEMGRVYYSGSRRGGAAETAPTYSLDYT